MAVRRARNSLHIFWAPVLSPPTHWVVFSVALLIRMPPLVSGEEVDCREVTGYVTADSDVPDTCTVPIAQNSSETESISSLKAKYQDFPLRCQLRKYTHRLFVLCLM